MLPNKEFLLIDYLDKNLSPEEMVQVESMIRNDKQLAKEWAYLKMAVGAVERNAIQEQVVSARQNFGKMTRPVAKTSGAVVRNMYTTALRDAAILIVVLGGAMFYKYSTVNNTSLYKQNFTDYTLSTARGESNQDAIEEAYRNKNWNAVMQGFNRSAVKTNEYYFLSGMAALELKKYPQAVSSFEHILNVNANSSDNYFHDEAEYYLALAYLMNHQTDKGVSMLNQIKANKNQVYNPLARQISATDLKILELKNQK